MPNADAAGGQDLSAAAANSSNNAYSQMIILKGASEEVKVAMRARPMP